LREMTAWELTHPDDLDSARAGTERLLAGDVTTFAAEKRYLTAAGTTVWVSATGALVRSQDGSPLNIMSQVQDITERKAHEQVLAEERRRLRAAQSIGRIGSWELDLATDTVTWSDTLSELYGLDPGDFPGNQESSTSGVHPDDTAQLQSELDACAADGTPLRNRHRVYRFSDGELRWFDVRGARHHDGDRFRLVGVVVDVTEQVLAETRLEHAALHDALTGLPNRRLVADRLARALDRSEREGQVVVLFCDLDGFKRVNDVHGHHVGDAVLVEAAGRMVAATRSGDTVGRMGGDEFVVICGVPRGENPAAVAELVVGRIERAMSVPIVVDGLEHRVTVSTGICLAGQGDNADLVLGHADVAMYLAKSQGKDGHATFDASLASDVMDRDSIERQIRVALADDTLEVYYQPMVEPGTGRVRAVEALMRVPDGAGQHLDTFQAVLVAERAGIITAIDDRVLRLACAQVALWRQQPGHGELSVSVNRSAIDIARPGLYERITEVVADSGFDPGALTIEITETVLLDVAPHTIADLERLRADGIGIAIDDFGTGYASLHYLATLPISSLKVDSSFTAGLPDDPTCATIVSATIGLAADLGLGCVVEEVETVEQLNALPASARLLVQGYLYARPEAPQVELPTHLERGR
jgi:diguanylate cyclase (GGDEF)-like protein/PAS domain S-box-containing protein